jgi:protein-S-isoprenylcysteine O-methyltransferase Ste14
VILTRVLLGLTVATWVVLEARQAARSRPDARDADHGSLLVLAGGTLAGFVAGAAAARLFPAASIPTAAAHLLALTLLWCGIALRQWCFRTLGESFTFAVQVSADQQVVSSGPYRWVRHPAYLGMVLSMLGLGALLESWASLLALLAVMTTAVVYRVRVEERALVDEMGEAYVSYAAGRKRLVPLVW